MHVTATAPNRVDFCGGTLDIYPIYLLLDGAVTVNSAVNIMSRVEITTRRDRSFHLTVKGLNKKRIVKNIDNFKFGGPFDLQVHTLRHFKPDAGLDITTHNEAPLGSGLGASSALFVAMYGAMSKLLGLKLDREKMISIIADVEARLIRIPTGKQDYFPPAFGGLSAVHFNVGPPVRENLSPASAFRKKLNDSLVLAYTGKSHFSALTNWRKIKNVVEGKKDVIRALGKIRDLSFAMRDAVLAADVDMMADVMNAEWQERKKLARGVSSTRLDRMLTAARRAGAKATKLCGAGGGGCLIALIRPEKRVGVNRALEAAGARVLDAKCASQGLRVKVVDG